MPIAPGDIAKVLSTYQGYPGTFDYDPRTPDGGSNMTLDYGQHPDHGQGIEDTWSNNSMNLLSGAFPANQVTSSSLPFGIVIGSHTWHIILANRILIYRQ